eukprot:gene15867-17465_t
MPNKSGTPGKQDQAMQSNVKVNNVIPVLHLKKREQRQVVDNSNGIQNRRFQGPPYLKKKTPPGVMRIATVSVRRRSNESSNAKLHKDADLVLPGLKDCIQSRPPINQTLSGPTVFTYSPPKDRPEMTTFPAYTFRPKTQANKVGGDRTSWGKEWFAHNYVWLMKADFDPRIKWPSPAQYDIKSTVGTSQPIFPRTPSHVFGQKQGSVFARKGVEDEPAPNAYEHQRSKARTMKSELSFTIAQGRKKGTVLWGKRESVPGPGSYETTESQFKSLKPRSAAFSFASTPRKFDFETRSTF